MEEISDRCCRPRRPTSRREGGRESPPTREGSGPLGATDPDHAGGAKQPNTILTAQAISPPPPTEHDERPRKRTPAPLLNHRPLPQQKPSSPRRYVASLVLLATGGVLKKGGGGWSVVGVPDSALVPEGAGV